MNLIAGRLASGTPVNGSKSDAVRNKLVVFQTAIPIIIIASAFFPIIMGLI
jgi:hypothetical protein